MREAAISFGVVVVAGLLFALPTHAFAATQVFLTSTSTTSWSVPTDWNSASNTIEVIGAGGASQYSYLSGGGDGGGGGAYSKISNLSLTPGGSASYHVGDGTALATTTTLRDTWFSSTGTVLAKGGVKGSNGSGGTGGAKASGVGTVTSSGGNGAPRADVESWSGGSGGGAGGPNGDGVGGASGIGASYAYGDAGFGGARGGGTGTEWDATHGSGGGGLGGSIETSALGQAGGLYGAGAGGNGCTGVGACSPNAFLAGGGGIITITYTPLAPTCTLSASRSLVPSGAAVALTWTTANGPSSASIDNGVGSVSTSGGTLNATVTTTTTYTLTVTNGGGSNNCTATVTTDGDKIVFLTSTSTTSWTVPSDWNNASNTVEVLGAGGGSQYIRTGGGGGGAYSKISNFSLTAGAGVSYQVGDATAMASSTSLRDTWFSSTGTLLAKGGTKGGASGDGVATGAGGASSSGVGTVKYSGGSASDGTGDVHNQFYGGGGGGAAGPSGAGDTSSGSGEQGSGDCGGDGDAGHGGSTGCTFSNIGTGTGQPGIEWDSSHGSGSGADGQIGDNVDGDGGAIVTGGAYGGGSGGNGCNGNGLTVGCSTEFQAGGMGLIVITYTPVPPTCTLTASRTLIPSGAAISLTWTTAGGPTSASIDNSIGSVATGGGATTTTPTATSTTYTLTVSNTVGSNTCSATVALDGDKIIFLTSGTSWTVPSDWNNASNTVEVIGAGGSADASFGPGGGAYSKKANVALTSGDSVTYQVGASSPQTYATNNTTDTWFESLSTILAKGAADNYLGGQAADGVGDVKYSGGADTHGGGGGAAGPHGNGGDDTLAVSGNGNGGIADAGFGGAGGLADAASHSDRNGGNGTEWDALHGAGGGGGYNDVFGGCGGLYGGGGSFSPEGQGCTGAQGLIVITYTPFTAALACTLSAAPSSVLSGGSSTLSWTTAFATSTSIDNGVGSVATSSGSTSVSPSTSTTYTLSVTGNNQAISCTATVGVAGKAQNTLFGGHMIISGGHIYFR